MTDSLYAAYQAAHAAFFRNRTPATEAALIRAYRAIWFDEASAARNVAFLICQLGKHREAA